MRGVEVVFVDCDKKTYNIDVKRIEKPLQIEIHVYLYVQPTNIDLILEIAKKCNILVIEDTFQAYGAKHKVLNVGTIKNCICFSFYPIILIILLKKFYIF